MNRSDNNLLRAAIRADRTEFFIKVGIAVISMTLCIVATFFFLTNWSFL